jgi:hypothetical protein
MSIQAGFLGHTPFLLFSPPPTGGFRGQLGCTSHTGFLFKKKKMKTLPLDSLMTSSCPG